MVDDGTNYYNLTIKKPWGVEKERYRDQNSSIWWLHIDAGKETSMHCHVHKTTTLIVRGGEGTLHTLHSKHELVPGTLVVIEAGAFHKTVSSGGPIVLYEIEYPVNKRDVVRLQDKYGRVGMGYERV